MDYRTERLGVLIVREVSNIVRREVKNPNISEFLTITDAKVSKDMQHAVIYFSVLNASKAELEKNQAALNSAAGFIRQLLKPKLTIRYTPLLKFFYDESFDRADRINTILHQIERENKQREDNIKKDEDEVKKPDATN